MKIPITLAREKTTSLIRHVRMVENGLRCKCICVECNGDFEAIQGESNIWHFRHVEDKICAGGLETALHMAAKQIVSKEQVFNLSPGVLHHYDKAELEGSVLDYRVDVLTYTGGKTSVVEIVVTHDVPNEKIDKITSNDLDLIVIDISNLARDTEWENLRQVLLQEVSNKTLHRSKIVCVEQSRSIPLVVKLALGYLGWKALQRVASTLFKKQKPSRRHEKYKRA